MKNRQLTIALFASLALFLTACGSIDVGIVQPPTPAAFYQPVPLGTAANKESDFESPPTGDITLGGVPYQLSERIFKSQAEPPPYDNYPTSALLETNVSRAHTLHLLINTGNGFAQFNEQPIGQVRVTCAGERTVAADLRLGIEVREWHLAHNIIYTAPRARQVWFGARASEPSLEGHIDMLSLDLPTACQDISLTAIEIADTSTETVDSLDPALNLFGLTVECNQ